VSEKDENVTETVSDAAKADERGYRKTKRGYVMLDDLHRRSLEKLVAQFSIKGLTEADLDYLTSSHAAMTSLAEQYVGLPSEVSFESVGLHT